MGNRPPTPGPVRVSVEALGPRREGQPASLYLNRWGGRSQCGTDIKLHRDAHSWTIWFVQGSAGRVHFEAPQSGHYLNCWGGYDGDADIKLYPSSLIRCADAWVLHQVEGTENEFRIEVLHDGRPTGRFLNRYGGWSYEGLQIKLYASSLGAADRWRIVRCRADDEAATPPLPDGYAAHPSPDACELGQGCWGLTRRARGYYDDRVCAIKTGVGPRFSAEQRACLTELRNLGRLPAHGNVVRYYHSIVDADDRLHIIMEFVQGEPLKNALVGQPRGGGRHNPRPWPTSTILAWAEQLFDGLSALHSINMVHRDLHEENVMLSADLGGRFRTDAGAIKIIDVGMARVLEGGRAARDADPGMGGGGHRCYFSRARRQELPYDDYDDVWAASCLLCETITGQRIRDIGDTGHHGNDFSTDGCRDARARVVNDCRLGRDSRQGRLVEAVLSHSDPADVGAPPGGPWARAASMRDRARDLLREQQ